LKLRIQVVSQHARHFSKNNPNWLSRFQAMEGGGAFEGVFRCLYFLNSFKLNMKRALSA
jgi:hypothetical protein